MPGQARFCPANATARRTGARPRDAWSPGCTGGGNLEMLKPRRTKKTLQRKSTGAPDPRVGGGPGTGRPDRTRISGRDQSSLSVPFPVWMILQIPACMSRGKAPP